MANITIRLKKERPGAVSLYLQDVEGLKPSRWFSMTEANPKLPINIDYALGIFLDNTLMRMWKANDFVIENEAELYKEARARGIIAEEFEVPKAKFYSKTAMMEILKKGEEEEIKALFSSPQSKSAYDMAVAKQEELTSGTIKLIEDFIKLQVRIDD